MGCFDLKIKCVCEGIEWRFRLFRRAMYFILLRLEDIPLGLWSSAKAAKTGILYSVPLRFSPGTKGGCKWGDGRFKKLLVVSRM